MECPSCRTKVPEEKRFCTECGAPLPSLCPCCGYLNPLGSNFCGNCGTKLGPPLALARPDLQQDSAPPQPTASAERRQLTVMFCDLVGSTALSARLDPEDMREIIGAYNRCCAEQIAKTGGFVAKYMGDGVLAYFGYPQAHEDDAERALHAALSVTEAVPKLRTSRNPVLQVRVGIATGLVVVGDLIGEGASQEQGVVGETPNLAARLQTLAEPGQVVISQSTRRLTGGMFEYRDLGRVPLKGLAEPTQAWQVLAASAVQSRFEAQHETSLTPLVGRDEELELLQRRWRQAAGGEGRVVLLSGEPGIGKSRLTVALQERLQGEPHTRLQYFFSPHHTGSAFYPVIAQLERAAEFERHDTWEIKLHKLASLLASPQGQENDIQLLAELLSIPTGDRYVSLNWTPQRKKAMTFEVLLRQLEILASQKPVLMVFEDVHWIDPSSRELLDMAVERAARIPLLLLITFRPEFAPPWTGQAHVTTLTLSRLGRREGAVLVEGLAGNNALTEEITAEIVERTDGIPLFVEELTKAVLEAGLHGYDGARTVSTAPPPALAVPATLHASLMARLDRLGSAAKEVAQIGAAIGREFSYELLIPIAQKSDKELKASLLRLSDAELVFCRGTPPDATFVFKHALVRDAAYGTLLRRPRQELHARIAKVLEERWPDAVETQPELLAHHFTQAELAERALDYWRRAGERALRRSANAEAVHHLTTGLELLAAQPDTPKRAKQELTLQISLAIALTATKGFAPPETVRAYKRARELCHVLGDQTQLFPATYGEWVYYNATAHHREAKRVAEEFLRLASDQKALDGIVVAHRTLGLSLLNLGQLQAGRDQMRQVEMLYQPETHRSLAFRYGQDPRAAGLSFLAWIEWLMGYPEIALKRCREAIDRARDLSHAMTLAYTLSTAPYVHYFCGDRAGASEAAEVAAAFDVEQRNPFWLAMAQVIRGRMLVEEGQTERGLAEICSGLDGWRATNSSWLRPCYLALFAEALAKADRTEEALEAINEALTAAGETGESFFASELYRLRGEFLLRLSTRQTMAQVETEYLRALELARSQASRSLELRASTSLARLHRNQGKRTEARDLLVPIYGWFTEGFDTLDLQEAKALLDELRS